MRIKCFTAQPEDIGALGEVETGDGARRFTLRVRRSIKDGVAAALSGISGREAAQALKGVSLYIPRSALPELAPGAEEYYQADLIGLVVRWLDEPRPDGRIVAVHNFGAGDLIEVALDEPDGAGKSRTVLLPFNRAVVPELDIGKGFVAADPPPGLIEVAPSKARNKE